MGHAAMRGHHEEMGRQGLSGEAGPRLARGPGAPALWDAGSSRGNANDMPLAKRRAEPFALDWEDQWLRY